MNFYGYVKNQSEMKMVFILLQSSQPYMMEPGDTVTISSVGMSTLQTYRVAKQHPGMHPYLGTWASILQNFSCVPKKQFD